MGLRPFLTKTDLGLRTVLAKTSWCNPLLISTVTNTPTPLQGYGGIVSTSAYNRPSRPYFHTSMMKHVVHSLPLLLQCTETSWCQGEGTPSSSGHILSTRRRLLRAWRFPVGRSSRCWTRCMTASWAAGWPSAWARTTSCWRRASSPTRAGGKHSRLQWRAG